ncbi:unnamed protein product [Alopecurus aequalis]
METPPAVPGGAAEEQANATAKRARKRSRYLSSIYDTAILVDDHSDIAASPRKGNEEEEEDAAALLPRLQGADLLAALHRSAASPGGDSSSPGPGVLETGVLLRFFALHRASVLAAKDSAVTAPAEQMLPNPCRAMVAVAAHGSAGKKQDHVYSAMAHASAAAVHSAQPAANSAVGCHIGQAAPGAAAAPVAGRKRGRKKKKVVFALDAHNAAAAAGCSAQPATGIANGFNSAPKRAKKKQARSSSGQGQHPGKPVALLLDFPHRPSKEYLLSTFRGFGSLIESHIGTRRARLVFESSAAAEAAYSCAHTLGNFTNRRLQYLRPPPPPAPKIPLADVRKNLERMIASLTSGNSSSLGGAGALDLAGQMLCLMAKVDKTLCAAGAPGPSTATAAHHQRY